MKKTTITYFISFLFCLTMFSQTNAQKKHHTFVLGDSTFLLDGKSFQMISGEMHYPRIPHEAWRARIKAAKAMGLNTIGTYIFWNLHEPQKGKFDFTGNNNVAEFVKIAQEEGLWVVLRPSPYVCAEWEFGGYPYWLQNEKDMVVRSNNKKFLEAYRNYILQVGKQLAKLQVNHGGNILMVQVENEYGSYGSDKEYLDINRKLFIEAGFDGLLYTCDGAKQMKNGYLPGLLPAVNGLSDTRAVKKLIQEYHDGKGPYYIAEWYPAWYDSWGKAHHTSASTSHIALLDNILTAGVSINMYMFHGGTTRGFMNGANMSRGTPYSPQTTSYDYDAPLDEAGNITDKFMQYRNVILKHIPKGLTLPDVPKKKETIIFPTINLTQTVNVFDILPKPINNAKPLTFEALNQDYGYVLYRTTITDKKSGWLKVKGLRDYGIIFVNNEMIGILDRRLRQDSIQIDVPTGKATLDIFVENMGRVNYGIFLSDSKKGISEKVTLNNEELTNWNMYKLPFTNINSYSIKKNSSSTLNPILKKGVFNLKKTGDTYLDMRKWGKGCVWINGRHLGRYWEIGPQQTLYVPAEWLKTGQNQIIILELIKPDQNTISSLDSPILNMLK